MKILSNFDTTLATELYEEYVMNYGAENVLFIKKSKRHLWYYVYLPLAIFALCSIAFFYFLYWYGVQSYQTLFMIILILWSVFFLVLVLTISRHFLDNLMDFMIITPDYILYYDQKGVFDRQVSKLLTKHIKMISFEKSWISASLFNLGTLHFLSEWEDDKGRLEMTYVDQVEERAENIRGILWFDNYW
jgi:hypothetical protein